MRASRIINKNVKYAKPANNGVRVMKISLFGSATNGDYNGIDLAEIPNIFSTWEEFCRLDGAV